MLLTAWLEHTQHHNPDDTALIYRDCTMTYAGLKEQVTRFAGALVSLGATKGTRVCILSQNSDRAIISFWAAMWAGCIPNFMNTRWSPTELELSIHDCQAQFLLVDENFCDIATVLNKQCPSIEHVIHIGNTVPTDHEDKEFLELIVGASALPRQATTEQDDAFINYTGGTTGKGKGVVYNHSGLVAAINHCLEDNFFIPGSTCALVVPIFHIGGITSIATTLITGGILVIAPAFNPPELLALCERHRVDTLFMVPTMYHLLINSDQFASYDLSALHSILYGGSPIDTPLLSALLQAFPNARFMQIYGQTEGVPISFLHNKDHVITTQASSTLASAGTPATDVNVCIRDPQGKPVADGTVGEITFHSTSMMNRYWNQPEQTAATLKQGWCYSGDAGYLKAGYLYIVDRIKDMIISGGENVYCAEIENALSTHPAISQCAVIGVKDTTWGERVHAVIVLQEHQQIDLPEIQQHCRQTLASYKIPRSFNQVDALPLTSVGKVDKVAIRALTTG